MQGMSSNNSFFFFAKKILPLPYFWTALAAHRALNYFYQPHHYQEYIEIAQAYPVRRPHSSLKKSPPKLTLHSQNAILAGAPFPDYLYECGNNHNYGEDAHWSPFQVGVFIWL